MQAIRFIAFNWGALKSSLLSLATWKMEMEEEVGSWDQCRGTVSKKGRKSDPLEAEVFEISVHKSSFFILHPLHPPPSSLTCRVCT